MKGLRISFIPKENRVFSGIRLFTAGVLLGFAAILTVGGCSGGREAVRIRAVSDVLRSEVIAIADSVCSLEPVTVTASFCPRSEGGPHDFYSEGDYWWPDPENPDGPYIRRDGESNPDNFSDHRIAMENLNDMVGKLCSAWIMTGDGRYAEAAEKHLRAWFIDPATRMNPSLNYAQAIKGRASGRGIGIIDTIHLTEVARSVMRFDEKGALSEECARGCREWFRQYLDWLQTHPYGQAEKAARNNHGTWWFAQVAVFAALTGDEAVIGECRTAYKKRFLPSQMAEDGSFPEELARTKPFNYSCFQLEAMVLMCQVLSSAEDNLWEFCLEDGRCIRKALDFMQPYLADKDSWPYAHDVQHWDEWPLALTSYALAWTDWGDKKYFDVWAPLGHFPEEKEMRRVLALKNPLIWL